MHELLRMSEKREEEEDELEEEKIRRKVGRKKERTKGKKLLKFKKQNKITAEFGTNR